jgi:hypothetical protein
VASKIGLADNLDSNSSDNNTLFNGVDFAVHGRIANGATFQGGSSTGRINTVTCQVDDPNNLRFCDQRAYNNPFRTRFRLSGIYPLPRNLRLSAVFQSLDGAERIINYTVTRTVLPALTRPSQVVRLNEPGSIYLPRINQLDLSLAGSINTKGLRVTPRLDIFNAMNVSTTLSAQNTFGPQLDRSLTILGGRLIRLGLNINY